MAEVEDRVFAAADQAEYAHRGDEMQCLTLESSPHRKRAAAPCDAQARFEAATSDKAGRSGRPPGPEPSLTGRLADGEASAIAWARIRGSNARNRRSLTPIPPTSDDSLCLSRLRCLRAVLAPTLADARRVDAPRCSCVEQLCRGTVSRRPHSHRCRPDAIMSGRDSIVTRSRTNLFLSFRDSAARPDVRRAATRYNDGRSEETEALIDGGDAAVAIDMPGAPPAWWIRERCDDMLIV